MNDSRDGYHDKRPRRIVARVIAIGVLGAPIGLTFSGGALAGQRGATASVEGADLFKTHCASCHDITGTGHGPMAPALRRAPTNLTLIAKLNGGMFPAARVRRIIDGQDVESHGDRDMPVWGDAFRTTRKGRSQESADARIAAIVRYLESIQLGDAH